MEDNNTQNGTFKKIREMVRLQEALNTSTNGTEWKNGYTDKGKVISWSRCIYMEGAEAIDSFKGWKHWKDIDAGVDYKNLKIEAIDIWHFAISKLLSEFSGEEITTLIMFPLFKETPLPVSQEIMKSKDWQDKTISLIESLMLLSLIDISSERTVKRTIDNRGMQSSTEQVLRNEKLIHILFLLFNHLGMDIDEVFSLYMGKNVLNSFRRNHNYMGDEDGNRYIKVWGKYLSSPYLPNDEDNVVMERVIGNISSSGKDVSFKAIYGGLEAVYKCVIDSHNKQI